MSTKTAAAPSTARKVSTAKRVGAKTNVGQKQQAKKVFEAVSGTADVCAHACACGRVCRDGEAFWVNHGPVIDSIAGLKEALSSMSDEQFAYHTMRDGNDFARWLRDSLDDTVCAARIEKAKTRAAAARALTGSCVSCA